MNKIFQYCSVLLFSVLTLALGSCTEEYEYSAAKVEGEQVYFSNALPSQQELSNKVSSFTVHLNRIVTDDELTVNISMTDESSLFTAPSSVTFAQGDSTVDITINYDPTKLEYDQFHTVTLTIADADYTTPYGLSSYTFSAGMSSPYVSLGKGKFRDEYFAEGYLEDEYSEVEIMQNQNDPNVFRVMHPYDKLAESGIYNLSGEPSEYLEFQVLQPGEGFAGQTVSQSGLVYFEPTQTSIMDDTYGEPIEIIHPAHFTDYQTEQYWTYSRVTNWQSDNGLPGTVQLAPMYYMEGVGGYDYTQQGNMVTIIFPNYDPKDYTVAVDYVGAMVGADEINYVMGHVNLGADVDEAKIAVVEGNDANVALNKVLSGAVESTTVTGSGEFRLPCTYSGNCTLVAIAYAGGEMMNFATKAFNYSLTAGEWKSLGTGLYTDHVFCLFLKDQQGNVAPPVTYPVEVQENTKTPGVYRVMTPYAPDVYGYEGDFGYDDSKKYNITIDAHDPDHVMITGQPLGFYDGDDALLIATIGGLNYDYALPQYGDETFDMLKDAGYINGTLKNGTITFPAGELLYSFTSYYSQGKARVVNDKEATTVLVLPDAVSAPAKAKAMKAKAAAKRKTYSVKYGSVRKAKVKKVKKPAIFLSKGRFSKNMIKF